MKRQVFRRALLTWYDGCHRKLPWRETTDFYPVWLSEIMLQQTRVEAVIGYYARFLDRFPCVEDLARAPEPEVLAAWSGLGYYSRARNLHRAAKQIAGAGLPLGHDDVLALPGAGPYTAAAISSIVLGLPFAAVDGNVMRVVSRIANDPSEISSPATRRRFTEIAGELLDRRRPGDFNQAMMELGATVCKPRNPSCSGCPVERFCEARAAGTERTLPVKLRGEKARDVSLDLVVVTNRGRVLLRQRGANESRLAGFWELPEKSAYDEANPGVLACAEAVHFRHQIVNDRFLVSVWTARTGAVRGTEWFNTRSLQGIPLTTVTKKALERTVVQGAVSVKLP